MPAAPVIQVSAIKKGKHNKFIDGERELLGNFIGQDIMHFNHLLNFSFDVKMIPFEVREILLNV